MKKLSSIEWFAEVTANIGYVSTDILRQAIAMHKQEIEDAVNLPIEKKSYESWEDIEEDYLKDNYPVFGGPFTDALTPFEWLKQYFNSPKRKK